MAQKVDNTGKRGVQSCRKVLIIPLADTFYDDTIEWTVFNTSIFFGSVGGGGGGGGRFGQLLHLQAISALHKD
jgi:hypothetical protein